MHKIAVLVILPFLFLGCKQKEKQEEVTNKEAEVFSFREIPNEVEINEKAQEILSGWPEYMAFESSFSILKRATNNEDLKLAIDDLLEKEKAMAEGDYPEEYDQLQIKSRQQVVKTFLLKIKGSLVNRTNVQEPLNEMVEAYNALKNQFNTLVSNTLDTKLILDEE